MQSDLFLFILLKLFFTSNKLTGLSVCKTTFLAFFSVDLIGYYDNKSKMFVSLRRFLPVGETAEIVAGNTCFSLVPDKQIARLTNDIRNNYVNLDGQFVAIVFFEKSIIFKPVAKSSIPKLCKKQEIH
ncbi:hypothetical protein INQ51_20265 [Maribellus sp. CM-23]|nr:hypothetical protein [Maribellus sp. CM-23]